MNTASATFGTSVATDEVFSNRCDSRPVDQDGGRCIFCGANDNYPETPETSNFSPPVIVMGERNRSSCPQSLLGSSLRRNASRSDHGRVVSSTDGTRRPRATFQNGVSGNCCRQNTCHREMVVRSAPMSLDSSRTRRGEGPCRIAAIKTTTAPK